MPMQKNFSRLMLAAALAAAAAPVRAEPPAEWISLGTRIHGVFGAFVPVGIRIGLDAKEKLNAGPRELTVTYYSGPKAPCPCIVDGIMLATQASPGQGTLAVSAEKAPAGMLAVAVIRHRKTGEAYKYSVPDKWLVRILAWNRLHDAAGRYDAAMSAEGLFQVEAMK